MCPIFHYRVVAQSCNQCPESGIVFSTTDSCIGNCTQFVSDHLEKDLCIFALQNDIVAFDGTPEDNVTFIVTVTGNKVSLLQCARETLYNYHKNHLYNVGSIVEGQVTDSVGRQTGLIKMSSL